MTSVASLDQSTSHRDLFEVPLDAEHAPVLLNGNGCESLFLALLFRLTIANEQKLELSNISLEATLKGLVVVNKNHPKVHS